MFCSVFEIIKTKILRFCSVFKNKITIKKLLKIGEILIVSPIVGTLICFKVQLSVHEFALIKKEDIVYPLVDIDSVFKYGSV